jgi:hypothetical protein
MKTHSQTAQIASALRAISLAFALPLVYSSADAAQTVWNVNLGNDQVSGDREITMSDNYFGAASENTPNSSWNAISIENNSVTSTGPLSLESSTGIAGTVTMNISAGDKTIDSGENALTTGDEIFYTWIKVSGNEGPLTVTFEGLPALGPGDSYALIIYSDWYWQTGGNMPITQTVGSGLTGTFNFNRYSGSEGSVGALLADTEPLDIAATPSARYNFVRINGLIPSAGNQLSFSMEPGNSAVSGFQLIKIDTADSSPPDPSPMTWETPPYAIGEASISMIASTATDPSGVEYQFTETSGNPGGSSSGWQNSPVFTDTGLLANTTYTYTVVARDKSPAQNLSVASQAESASTDPLDTTPPAAASFAITPAASSISKIIMTANTLSDTNGVQYYFTETSGNIGGSDSGWQDSPVYEDSGLTPGVTYTYKVKARDKSISLNEGAESATASAATLPEGTSTFVWNVNIGNEITTSDNFIGAAVENTANSFWNSVTTANPNNFALADSSESLGDGVSLTVNGLTQYAAFAPITSGPEIFSSWIKSQDNSTPFTMVIGGLVASRVYDIVFYSDWFWKGNGTLPITLTAGSGLTGTAVLNQISTGTYGTVTGLVLDTDLADNNSIEGNWLRIRGLTPDGDGKLAFSMGGTNAAFNGFQLVQVSSLLARINSFGIPGASGVINQADKTISLTVPFGTDLATLAPTFTLSTGSTCNQTSGAAPSPTFASSSTVNYVVTDATTAPTTVNTYAVTVTVAPAIGTLVINLGEAPGTFIPRAGVISTGPLNLPIPALPVGSILRSVTMNVVLQSTDNDNSANEISLLFGPSSGNYTYGFVAPEMEDAFSPVNVINWDLGIGDGGPIEQFDITKTDADWNPDIDLGSLSLFLGNSFDSGFGTGGNWSGTITLTYDIPTGGSAYGNWATGNQPFQGDANGDGVPDGMAFLLGAATPAENAITRLPQPENDNGLVMRFTCRDAANRSTSTLKVQWSHNLGLTDPWSGNEAIVPAASSTVNGVVFVITENPTNPALDDVVATIPSSEAQGGKLFGRLLGLQN